MHGTHLRLASNIPSASAARRASVHHQDYVHSRYHHEIAACERQDESTRGRAAKELGIQDDSIDFTPLLDPTRPLYKETIEGMSDEDIDLVQRARKKSKLYSISKVRKSGESAFSHFEKVAWVVRTFFGIKSAKIIAAAYLHDYIEDMMEQEKFLDEKFFYDELCDEFGKDVAEMVLGVTKFTHDTADRMGRDHYTLYLKRLLSHCVGNVAVGYIKLADNIVNMLDQEVFRRDKQISHAQEAAAYASLALSLSVEKAERILADSALRWLESDQDRVDELERMIARSIIEGAEILHPVREHLLRILRQRGINGAKIEYYPKNIAETLRTLGRVDDLPRTLFGVNRLVVILDNEQQCYDAVGYLIRAWSREYGAAAVKVRNKMDTRTINRYQALEVELDVPGQGKLDVVIQTRKMFEWAREGPASLHHAHPKRKEWYRDTTHMQVFRRFIDGEEESPRSIRDVMGQLGSRAMVFTPRGRIIDVPRKGSWLDVAYKIHSEKVGPYATAARIKHTDGRVERVDILDSIVDGVEVEILFEKGENKSVRLSLTPIFGPLLA